MKVTVLFFSLLRDLTGVEKLSLSLDSEDARLAVILERLYCDFPGLREWDRRLLLAVNAEYAGREDIVRNGDEIALMPPV